MNKKLLGFYIFLALVILNASYKSFMAPSLNEISITNLTKELKELKETVVTIKKEAHVIKEMSYFEGQRDAITGDIRIEEIEKGTGKYKWGKSPWDSGESPVYKIDEKLTN